MLENAGLLVYLLGLADKFLLLVGLVLVVSMIAIAITAIAYFGERVEEALPHLKISFGVFIVSTILVLIIPTKSTLVIMLSASAIVSVAQSPDVQETGGKALKLLNKYLDEGLEDGGN